MIGTNLSITTKNYAVAGGAVAYDADALSYFTANTAITSDADKNAINTFYLGLKSDGIYTKIKAMYLPIWGSETTCKWNLVNPLDTDAAFRLKFSTGWTFSSGGMTPTNAYADTYITPSTHLSLNNTHLSYYSRTNVSANTHQMGCSQLTSESQYLTLITRYASNTAYYAINVSQSNISGTSVSNSDSRGLFIGNRTASNVVNGFRNATKQLNSTTTSSLLPNTKIFLGAINSFGTAGGYSTNECSFSSIGTGLTDTEASNFYTRVNTLMTYFGINV